MKEKILIIEDDFTIQTQLKTLLSGNGYEVFAVTDFSKTIVYIFFQRIVSNDYWVV